MKVLRFSPEFYLGKEFNRGLSLNLFYLVKGLKNLGVKQHIFTPSTNHNKWESVEITKIRQRNRFSIFLLGLDSYKAIKDEDFDLIHTHNYGFFSMYHYKDKLARPMVHSIHGNPVDFLYQKPKSIIQFKEMLYTCYFTKYICKRADAVIALCDEYRDDIINRLHVPAEKVYYIPTQVDASIFRPQKRFKDIDLLYTGRFASLKLVPTIVMVVYFLAKLKPDIKVVLVGGVKEDNEYDEVTSLVKNYSLEKNIEIVPPVVHRNIVDYYNRSKAFIFITNQPGIGKSALEAMACGLPLVTNVSVREGECNLSGKEGLVGLKLDPKYIASEINNLLKDESLMIRSGKYNRSKVLKYFTPEVTSKKIFGIYSALLND